MNSPYLAQRRIHGSWWEGLHFHQEAWISVQLIHLNEFHMPKEEESKHPLELLKVNTVLLQIRQAGIMPVSSIAVSSPVAASQMFCLNRRQMLCKQLIAINEETHKNPHTTHTQTWLKQHKTSRYISIYFALVLLQEVSSLTSTKRHPSTNKRKQNFSCLPGSRNMKYLF